MQNKIDLNEKIFIAGASGMAGSAIYRMLKKNGYGSQLNNGSFLIPSREELDLKNYNLVQKWFEKWKPISCNFSCSESRRHTCKLQISCRFMMDNLLIQNNIINCAWKNKVKRLLFLGSSCIYPKSAQQPIQEESLLCGELEETNIYYALAKISGLKLCQS